jgi:hypothetical protein
VASYWKIGREILTRQEAVGTGSRGYGARIIARLAADISADPALKSIGASKRNLQYMRKFAAAWPDWEKVQPAVALSSWKHQTILLDRLDDPDVDGDEFRLDLLFFHTRLNRFVVFELKAEKFHPKHAGQAAFYAAIIDREARVEKHRHGETIGVVLCRDYSETVAETALSRSLAPLVVSRYRLDAPVEQQGQLPADLTGALPDPAALAEKYAEVVIEETRRLDQGDDTDAEDE